MSEVGSSVAMVQSRHCPIATLSNTLVGQVDGPTLCFFAAFVAGLSLVPFRVVVEVAG
jgi:hypothetical protein